MKTVLRPVVNDLPPIFKDIPIIYEDDEFEEILMGENWDHYQAGNILFNCISAHLKRNFEDRRACCNLNCYYRNGPKSEKSGRKPYFTPDVMVIESRQSTGDLKSYTIGKDGPPPIFVCEILSQLSGTIRDPIQKPEIYAKLGIAEYLLVDELGKFLPQPLLLKKLREDRTWEDSLDEDGGVTSRLGFRVIHDGQIRVLDAATGRPYIRPGEAEEEVEVIEREKQAVERRARTFQRRNEALERSKAEAEVEIAALKAELAALRKKRSD